MTSPFKTNCFFDKEKAQNSKENKNEKNNIKF